MGPTHAQTKCHYEKFVILRHEGSVVDLEAITRSFVPQDEGHFFVQIYYSLMLVNPIKNVSIFISVKLVNVLLCDTL